MTFFKDPKSGCLAGDGVGGDLTFVLLTDNDMRIIEGMLGELPYKTAKLLLDALNDASRRQWVGGLAEEVHRVYVAHGRLASAENTEGLVH